jgi:hypothetical protein
MRYELILISTVNELKHYLSPDNLLLDLIDKYNVYRYAETKKICKHCLYALCSNVNKQQELLDYLGLKIDINNHALEDEYLLEEKVQSQEHKCVDVNVVANSVHSEDSNNSERNNKDMKDTCNKQRSMFVINSNKNECSDSGELKSVKESKINCNKLNENLLNNNGDDGNNVNMNSSNNCSEIEEQIKILSECNDIQSKNYAKISEAIAMFIKEAKLENEYIQIKEQILNQDDNYHNTNISNLVCFD